ncbi:MAG: YbaB/EbfC family nucleoid-associated protein [Phycisphaerae bacterium]|nr:YbaB/EbfC family nucleoid-associated protein [Phycisphaerae bacterium]
MFDSLKNLGAMASIMKDLPRIKSRMEEVRRKAEASRVAATSGGGAVTVVASGRLRIESVTLDPAIFAAGQDPESRALAAELVRQATNDALERAQAMLAQMLGDAARELNLPISAEELKGLL